MMIKIRIIPTLLYKDFTLVKGVRFDSWRRIGDLIQAIKVYAMREVDELVFLDISASLEGRSPDFTLIDDFADECFMPLTVGGGVRSSDDVGRVLRCGADKVAINSAALEKLDVVESSAKRFGSQAVVVSMDARRKDSGSYEIFSHSGTRSTGWSPKEFAKAAENAGAGEILLTSIDRDGTMLGYDIELLGLVTGIVSIPVVASGGAGKSEHMYDALVSGRASAVAAGSMYHFTQITPMEVKTGLKSKGINVRI